MHAKLVVADDTTFVGSFNFSRSGELNAENVLEIRDAAIADRLAAYVDELRARYPPATVPRRARHAGVRRGRSTPDPYAGGSSVSASSGCASARAERRPDEPARVQVDVVPTRVVENRLQSRRHATGTTFVRFPVPSRSAGSDVAGVDDDPAVRALRSLMDVEPGDRAPGRGTCS